LHATIAHETTALEKFRHGTPLAGVNNAVGGGPLFLTLTTIDASDATHYKAQTPSVRFVTVFVANVLV